MAKLYFRYGVVTSAKTMNLLAVYESYRHQGKKIFAIKPSVDSRSGIKNIASRSGLKIEADLIATSVSDLSSHLDKIKGASCVVVDEVQFFCKDVIDFLHHKIAIEMNIPVICYGLRTDFQTHLFEGSARLMEIADSLEEVKTVCVDCNRKAIFSARIDSSGQVQSSGELIALGGTELYAPMCKECYWRKRNP